MDVLAGSRAAQAGGQAGQSRRRPHVLECSPTAFRVISLADPTNCAASGKKPSGPARSNQGPGRPADQRASWPRPRKLKAIEAEIEPKWLTGQFCCGGSGPDPKRTSTATSGLKTWWLHCS